VHKILIVSALPHELDHAPIPHDIPVIFTGVGKLNAAISLTDALLRYQPSLVINFGTAGRVSDEVIGLVEVGDVIQRDMAAEPLAPRGTTPFDQTSPLISSGYQGIRCATGDSFVSTTDQWLHEQGVHVVDMELFALALVCHRRQIAWRSFKYITDDTDESAGQDWFDKIHHGRDLFLKKLDQMIVGFNTR
jgi:adenosylhomocysteine nucleosidase